MPRSGLQLAAADQRLAQSSIAATASISISHPGRIRRFTTTNVPAGGFDCNLEIGKDLLNLCLEIALANDLAGRVARDLAGNIDDRSANAHDS